MQKPLTRTPSLIIFLAAAAWALQRPATRSLARRRAASPATSPSSGSTPFPAAPKDRRRAAPLSARRGGSVPGKAKDARRAAPRLAAARREGQLSRMQNVEGWRGNNGRWRKYEEIKQCAAGRRSYVPVGDFFNLETPDPKEEILWNSGESLLGVAFVSYFAYPAFAAALGALPGPNSVEGGYFFSFLSIVYGTLTAATISDATGRLAALRETIVEECSLMLPLLERLRITLLEKESELCFHVTDIISGTREIELELMSTRTYDPLINIVGALHRAQYRYDTNELDYAIERTEEVIRVRGRRLQLEGSGIPLLQFALLRVLSGLIVLTYTYLTLDRPEVTASVLGKARLFTEMQVLNHAVTTATPATTTLLGMAADGSGVWLMDPTLGVRILFAIIVGTLVSFNSLAADYNRPFRGAFKIESETVTASLRQLRETLSPYCDVNGCVVPESADDAGGFGGIIAPPWWDDFQEP